MSYNPFTLAGKTILVTGASSGIGKATAIECSKMGANVILTARNNERLEETLSQCGGGKITPANLVEQEDIENLVNSVPSLDGVVFSAGKGMTMPFNYCSRDKFDEIFNINFFSTIETFRLLSKKKKLNKGCSVVFIVSIGGTYKYPVGNSIYGASKAAMRSMIHSCVKELSSKQIRVNGIYPGMVETPLIHNLAFTEEQLKEDMNRYPLKRYGKPEEIAYGAIYLLSDASAWVTGQDLVIDGGITAR